MSGLLALLDDVAGLAKAAAASVDDVTAQAMKASTKAAGVVIDDAAVTPKYVTGLAPARELPIIWKIARGSIFNKLIILLPLALILSAFVPWIITPLLMIGGLYLCFEGAEKILHWLAPHANSHGHGSDEAPASDPAHLEEERVRGAIKTDFILSAEIMTIILNELPQDAGLLSTAFSLGLAGLIITAFVYGAVAVIVKVDDLGVKLVQDGRTAFGRRIGLSLVQGMPGFLKGLSTVGTLAMLWVGGSIVLHGLEVTHWWAAPYEIIHAIGHAAGEAVELASGFISWLVTAVLNGVVGFGLGCLVVWAMTKVVWPLWASIANRERGA